MNAARDYHDLPPDLDQGERADLIAVAERLERERPLPNAGFRARVQAIVAGGERSAASLRSVKLRVTALASSGLALVGLAVIGLAGAGPFAA